MLRQKKKELTSPSRASCHGPSEAKCLLATSCRPACRGEGPLGPPPRPGMMVLVLPGCCYFGLWGSFRKKDPTTQIQEGKPAQDVPRFTRARAMTALFEISDRRYYCLLRLLGRRRERSRWVQSGLRLLSDLAQTRGGSPIFGRPAVSEAHTKVRVRVRVIIIGVVLFVVSAVFFL